MRYVDLVAFIIIVNKKVVVSTLINKFGSLFGT